MNEYLLLSFSLGQLNKCCITSSFIGTKYVPTHKIKHYRNVPIVLLLQGSNRCRVCIYKWRMQILISGLDLEVINVSDEQILKESATKDKSATGGSSESSPPSHVKIRRRVKHP